MAFVVPEEEDGVSEAGRISGDNGSPDGCSNHHNVPIRAQARSCIQVRQRGSCTRGSDEMDHARPLFQAASGAGFICDVFFSRDDTEI